MSLGLGSIAVFRSQLTRPTRTAREVLVWALGVSSTVSLGVGSALSMAGCECADSMPIADAAMVDAYRPRRDGSLPDAVTMGTDGEVPDGFVPLDAPLPDGPLPDAYVVPGRDSAIDAYTLPDAFRAGPDAGPASAVSCPSTATFVAPIILGRDQDTNAPVQITVAASATRAAAVYSNQSGAGIRSLYLSSIVEEPATASEIMPVSIPGTTDATLPAMVAAPNGFALAYVLPSSIELRAFDTSLVPRATSIAVALTTITPTIAPAIYMDADGGVILWAIGTTIYGRTIDSTISTLGAESVVTTLPADAVSIQVAAMQNGQLTLGYATRTGGSYVAPLERSSLGVSSSFALASPAVYGTALDLAGPSGTAAGAAVFDDGATRPQAFLRFLQANGRPSTVAAIGIGEGNDPTFDPVVEPIPTGFAMGYISRDAITLPPYIRLAFTLGTDLSTPRITSRCQIVGFDQAIIESVTFSPLALSRLGASLVVAWGEAHDMYTDYYVRVVRVPE